jgi:hypothetical protein
MSEPRRRGMSLDEMIGFEDKSQSQSQSQELIPAEKVHEMELRTGMRGLTYLVPGMNTSAGSLANPTVHLPQKLTLEAEVRIRDLGEGLWAMSDLAEKEMDEMWREEKERERVTKEGDGKAGEKAEEAQNESAGKRSLEELTKDGVVRGLLGKERTTWEREVASHTAGRSAPDVPKELG